MGLAHPGEKKPYREVFRFEVEGHYQTAFSRQLGEAVRMKNSRSIILNRKEDYSRCIVPDLGLHDRGWREDGRPKRDTAKFEGTVKCRENGPTGSGMMIYDNMTVNRRKRLSNIKFKRQKKRNIDRIVYKKVTRQSSTYCRKESEILSVLYMLINIY